MHRVDCKDLGSAVACLIDRPLQASAAVIGTIEADDNARTANGCLLIQTSQLTPRCVRCIKARLGSKSSTLQPASQAKKNYTSNWK